jgi:hypothetical protein
VKTHTDHKNILGAPQRTKVTVRRAIEIRLDKEKKYVAKTPIAFRVCGTL